MIEIIEYFRCKCEDCGTYLPGFYGNKIFRSIESVEYHIKEQRWHIKRIGKVNLYYCEKCKAKGGFK